MLSSKRRRNIVAAEQMEWGVGDMNGEWGLCMGGDMDDVWQIWMGQKIWIGWDMVYSLKWR